MGTCSTGSRAGSDSGSATSTGTQSSTKPITYASPSEKEQMKRDITSEFFNNYREFGEESQKLNQMIIDGFLKDGMIDDDMAESLRKTESKVRKLEVDMPKSDDLKRKAAIAEERLKEKSEKRSMVKQNQNTGGLGMNPGYTAVTSTYKRFKARQRRKFDEWWKGNH